MTARHLSPEIVSLIHHVELNESGWWRKAVGQVVKGVLWKADSARTSAELHLALKRELGIPFTDDVLQRQLEMLVGQGAVTRMPGLNYKLTERAREELTSAHRRATDEQEQCRNEFIASCAQHCSELDAVKVWDEFTRHLADAVQLIGANLFHLLADGNLERDTDWLAKFLTKFDLKHQEGLRKILGVFFAPGNHACRNQVLRLLSAHFFAEASRLSPATLSVIEGERKKRFIKVVLDTNFIFSVLQLHDNPGDEAVLSLVDVAQKSGHHLEIKLYVLPSTLDEAQKVLLNQMHMVERIRTTVAMSRAALTQPLSSIAKKFFDAAAKSPGLTASSFFQPYIDDLRTILRGKGIAVLEAHPTIYHQRQDVVDDVLGELRREEAEVQEDRRKGYDTLLHDVVLWHAVKDRRPEDNDSPFEVEYWAVSIDWRLIAFDRQKRLTNASKLPVVLHPSNLVQLVQFWIPRSEVLESSLIDSLRLPLFFQSFDPEDERATVKVLEAISRFENVGDIPEETLKVVLANQVLRRRLRDADASNDEVFALVRDELIAQHKNAVKTLEETRGSLTTTAASLEEERKGRKQSEKSLRETSEQLAAAKTEAAKADKKAADAEKRAAEAEAARLAHAQVAAASQGSLVRLRYAIGAVVGPAAVGLLLGIWTHGVFASFANAILTTSATMVASIAVGLLPLAVAFVASPYITARHAALQSWWLSKFVNVVGKKAFVAPGFFIFSAVFQGGVWDWVKAATHWTP